MSNCKVLAITSFPTIGNAGLKNIISVLGTSILPVPTTIACGLGNMEGHLKIEVAFQKMLISTIEIAKNLGQKLIVYTGYFTSTTQIDCVKSVLETYKELIEYVIVDPVCGDHNKAYVASDIIEKLKELIEYADLIVPNYTEMKFLLGENNLTLQKLVDLFLEQYSYTKLLITSCQQGAIFFNYFVSLERKQKFYFNAIEASYSGTGDLYIAFLIKYHFFEKQSFEQSVIQASKALALLINYNLSISTPMFDFRLDSKILLHHE